MQQIHGSNDELSNQIYVFNSSENYVGQPYSIMSEKTMRMAAAVNYNSGINSETLMKSQNSIPQIVIFGGELEDGSVTDKTYIYTPPYELDLAAIDITPGDVNLNIGETVQFVAKGIDAEQMAVSLIPQWSADGGDIDATGLFTANQTGTFTITAANQEGIISGTANVTVASIGITSAEGLPKKFNLSQNFPNPFNPTTTIQFAVKEKCRVVLKIYDILGRETTTLIEQVYESGFHQIMFDATQYATGIYIYKIQMKDFYAVKKMVLLE